MAKNKYDKFVFTWNNYKTEDVNRLQAENPNIVFIRFGKEVAPTTGTPHLQGMVHTKERIRFSTLKALLDPERGTKSPVHVEAQRGNNAENFEYTGKDHDYFTRGEPILTQQGKRTDWHNMRAHAIQCRSLLEFSEQYPEAAIKYPGGISRLIDSAGWFRHQNELTNIMEAATLKPFQTQIIDIIDKTSLHSGKVIWIYDEKGQTGKTFLTKYLYTKRRAMVLSNGKTADIAHAWKGQELAVVDLSRTSYEHLNMDALERLSCGMMFSGKYDSCEKVSTGVKVVCMSNGLPPWTALSLGRWEAFELVDGNLNRLTDPRT